MRPATSLIGARSGRPPRASVTVSYAMAVEPERMSPSACGLSAARWRYVKSTCPGRSRAVSIGCGSLTLTISSVWAKTSSAFFATRAPAARYASSVKPLPAPAPVSTRTSWP